MERDEGKKLGRKALACMFGKAVMAWGAGGEM
jgi:hypothetical protein